MEDSQVLPPELTPEEVAEIEANSVELAKTHQCGKVHAYVGIRSSHGNERVIAYIKEPNFQTKLGLMDKAAALGMHQAADELRQFCLLTEESHPLTKTEHPEGDPFKLGVVMKCLEIIEYSVNALKKK